MPVESKAPIAKQNKTGVAGAFVSPFVAEQEFNLRPSHAFIFMAHPSRWDVYQTKEGAKVLPFLHALEFQPGLNGVRYVDGEIDGNASAALAARAESGWIRVPHDLPGLVAFGEPVPSYAQRYLTNRKSFDKQKLYCWRSAWERVKNVGSRVLTQRDPDGYHAFLQLVKDQIMLSIDENVVAELSASIQDYRLSISKAAARTNTGNPDIELATSKIAAVEKESALSRSA